MKKTIINIFIIITMVFMSATNIYAQDDIKELSLDDAVKIGLEKSVLLQQVANESSLSDIKNSSTLKLKNDLIDGSDDYDDSKSQIDNANGQIYAGQAAINQAMIDINKNLAPQLIQLSSTISIPKGTNIITFFTVTLKAQVIAGVNQQLDEEQANLDAGHGTMTQAQINAARAAVSATPPIAPFNIPVTSTVTIPSGSNIESFLSTQADGLIGQTKLQIEKQQRDLNLQQITLSIAKDSFNKGSIDLSAAKEGAQLAIQEKLGITEVKDLSIDDLGELLEDMAKTANNVTAYAQQIYRNQISLLIKKNYYDAIKANKICNVKKKAISRAKTQYDFAKQAYNFGMKSKDEMLQAKMYYASTRMEYKKSLSEYNNSLIELKKNMGMKLSEQIVIKDVVLDDIKEQDLDDGIRAGLLKRLEIVKAQEEYDLYDNLYNRVVLKYGNASQRGIEAQLLRSKAEIKLKSAKSEAESSIRESYETLQSVKDMLDDINEIVEDAKENLKIAKYKYEEGFSADNSMLKQLGIESSSGTILEKIAAEEKLTQAEEKKAEIENGYNLALSKYLDDIVQYVY